MEHRNANNPKGINVGPVNLIDMFHRESVLGIPSSFVGKQEFRRPEQREHTVQSLKKAWEATSNARRESEPL